MGTTTYCKIMQISDWINIVSIIVNIGLTLFIVRSVQNKQNNTRVLKDFMISEVKEIKANYKELFKKIQHDKIQPSLIIPWFKSSNGNVNDTMRILNDKFGIEKNKLKPFQFELNKLITDNDDYTSQFNTNYVTFSQKSKDIFSAFENKYNKLFTELIISINEA